MTKAVNPNPDTVENIKNVIQAIKEYMIYVIGIEKKHNLIQQRQEYERIFNHILKDEGAMQNKFESTKTRLKIN